MTPAARAPRLPRALTGPLGGALLACLLAGPSSARADAPPPTNEPSPSAAKPGADGPLTIVVLSGPSDPFGLRLRAEIETLGFHALLVEPDKDPATVPSLEAAARASGAFAAIRAISSDNGVEVWIADRVTGKTVIRRIASPADASEGDAALALAAVDLLRASLLEVALPGAPPGEVPDTPEISRRLALPAPRSLARVAPPIFRVSLGVGALWSPGGVGAAASLDVGLSWIPTAHVGVAGNVSIPLSRPTVSSDAGQADLSVWLGGVGLRFLFLSPWSRWAPSADAGVMVTSMESRGTASPGFVAKQVSSTTAAPFVRAGVALAVTPMLRFRADLLLGLVVQGVSLRIAEREVRTFGQPLLLSTLGADVGWF